MPDGNRFQHQSYPTQPVVRPVLTRLTATVRPGFDFTVLHNELGIRDVILVHGTFMGDDPFGIREMLNRVADGSPLLSGALRKLGDKLAQHTRPLTNLVSKDLANYTPEYVQEFQKLVGDDPQVRLLDPTWSSQNHHLARADLAVRLLVHLDELNLDPNEERVLLWGHSHAGNGFAILTNLLANHRESVGEFFETADDSREHWVKARQILAGGDSPHPLSKTVCIATFGTPVRYGWDTAGCCALIHVHHHIVDDDDKPFRAAPVFPVYRLDEILRASHGDWVQAFAIAGTDIPTGAALKAHAALERFLHRGLADPDHGLDTKVLPPLIRDTCARWKTGTRCHTDGINLLLSYEPCGRKTRLGRPVEESVFGHGVQTTIDWLAAHLALIEETLKHELRDDDAAEPR